MLNRTHSYLPFFLAFIQPTNIQYVSGLAFEMPVEIHPLAIGKNTLKRPEKRHM